MPITDTNALKFSNEHIRTSADRLARRYYLGLEISNQWTALGGGQTATDALRSQIWSWCNYCVDYYNKLYDSNRRWVAYGSTMLPASDTISDGAPTDGRPAITTDHAITLATRISEAISDLEANSYTKLNTIYTVIKGSAADLSAADAGTAINRMTEIISDLEATSNAKLNSITQVAVNTGA